MTVSSTNTKNSYSGNGSTTVFAYTFKIFDDDDITVILRTDATGGETVQTKTTDYTVSGVGDAGGGNITFGTAPASGITVVLIRETAQTQATDYTPNDPFPAASHEDALDKLTLIIQDQQEELDRSFKVSRTNTSTSSEFTVGAADRANRIFAFDSSGDLSVTQEIGTYQGTDTTTTTSAYSERDIVKSTTAGQLNNVYICVADSVAGDLLTDTDHFELLVDAVSAATSATNAASSATAAASSATDAETAQTAAETAQTAAETAQTGAETAETNAETAQAAAEAAQAAAETALDNFDDIYLGAKASDPTLDNDGDALTAGDLYFNTTTDELKYYTGSAWEAISPGISNVVEDTTPQLGGDLDVNGNSIVSVSNGDINITPNGTGNVSLGNFTFDADQTVGAGQDNYLMTYDNGSGTISLEAAPAGGAGYFQGENGATGDTTNGKGDIFRVHEQQLDTNTTIASGDNAGAFFSLTVASGVTLTINGNLVIA